MREGSTAAASKKRIRESRAGEHARKILGDWKGSLTCDDFSGYKALIATGVTEVGSLAHARRKFFDLHAVQTPTSTSWRRSVFTLRAMIALSSLSPELNPSKVATVKFPLANRSNDVTLAPS